MAEAIETIESIESIEVQIDFWRRLCWYHEDWQTAHVFILNAAPGTAQRPKQTEFADQEARARAVSDRRFGVSERRRGGCEIDAWFAPKSFTSSTPFALSWTVNIHSRATNWIQSVYLWV